MAKKVTIFQHSGYRGFKKEIGEGDYETLSRWEMIGGPSPVSWNDQLSSIIVPSGMEVTLYEHTQFRGRKKTFYQSASQMSGGWNDLASSIKVRVRSPGALPKVVIYEHIDFGGSCQYLDVGRYDLHDLTIGNDVVSSVKVPTGMLLILYEHKGFNGKPVAIDRNVPRLSSEGFNDRTSSVVVLSESQYNSFLNQKQATAYDIGDYPRMTDYNPPTPVKTTPILIGETLIPFLLVNEEYEPELQARETPYYILSRSNFWELVRHYDHSGRRSDKEVLQVKTGISKTTADSIKSTLRLEFTASGGINAGALSLGLASKLTKELEFTHSESETELEETMHSLEFFLPEGERVALAIWQMVDQIKLRRLDGSIVKSWEVFPEIFGEDSYPPLPT